MTSEIASPPPPAAAEAPAPGNALVIVRGGRQRKLLSEPILFEEASLPAFVRAGLLTAAGFLVLFLIWASIVHIDEIAAAPGQVIPTGSVKVVQHLEGGSVAEILVSEGQEVAEGAVLIRMDTTDAMSEHKQMLARYYGLLLRAERLKAVRENRKPDFASVTTDFPDLALDQERLWHGQIAARKSALEVIDSQVDQKRREIKQLKDALNIAHQQLKLAGDQTDIRQQAADSGVVSRQTYLETARAKVAAQGEVARLTEQIQVNTDALAEAVRRRASLDATQEQDTLSELGSVAGEAEQVKNALTKLLDRVQRTDVRAPVSGRVQDLKVNTVGEVVPAGGTLMRVVPSNAVLEAEVRIATADVGHVAPGQPVKVKVSSYDYNRYGMLPGTVKKVSPTTYTSETDKTPYYRGIVEISRPYMGPGENQNLVLPGMSVEADIVTGNKVLIEYLFKPVFVSLKSSFHER
ncbi:HlyD family type I secretion periplasmic adaptor subunit [Magnetospirillum sp. UT-4]|uniref:HlyD family type I secretion periplasmic adaptor subunit n=1 Tax=Magnetospirillum sp. UT-4 TaxID=2681467 RepID=UPI0013838C48|nr:HlyD family type I secretion periplasmic adaptor subunit [Magnetospirillum sp. UT-4]CAA7612956.1 Type I secretion membrane fusion protein, HlyD family [Magnetospirillum sp. UT-4]